MPYFWKAGTFTADQERVLQTAVARWNEQAGTAVKWVWDTSAANAVLFIRGDSGSCGWSSVGSVGGQQQLAINCFNSRTVIHEMGHAAGQWHEHQRCDRDKYVAIPTQYQGDSGNFGRNCNIYSYGPYDYDSVMNYGSPYVSALSQPGGPYAGDPRNLGRPADLSAGDISALRTTYLGSDSGTPAPPTPAPTPVREYTGTLSQGQVAVQPQGSSFTASSGTVTGQLSGPSTADFDLYLQRWNGSSWVYVASSEGPGSTETVRYEVRQQSTLRWVVYAYSGGGSYRLTETR